MYGAIRGIGFGDVREFAQLGRGAIALAEESSDPALHMAIMNSPWGIVQIGEYREAVAPRDRAIELADGDLTVGAGIAMACPYAFCLIAKGYFGCNLGELEENQRLIEQGTTIAREQGDTETVGWGHTMSAWIAHFLGEPEAMLGHTRQSVEIAERIGSSFSRAHAWLSLGYAERTRGEWQAAIEALERSQAIASENSTAAEADPLRLAELGEAYLGLGEPERAREFSEQGLQLAHGRSQLWAEKHASIALARVLLGSLEAAAADQVEAALARALELARDTGAKAFEPLIHVELAKLARQLGDEQGRERELREALRLFTEIGATGHVERLSAELPTPAS